MKRILTLLLLTLFSIQPILAEEKPLTSFEEVAQYIKAHNKLPPNFITKKEARKQGWNPSQNYLSDVLPGKSIGGDVFGNFEKRLPHKKKRKWFEADIDYKGGKRNAKRIVFSNDGLIFKTEDHYKTFQEMKL